MGEHSLKAFAVLTGGILLWACTQTSPLPPPLTPETQADLISQALGDLCAEYCGQLTIYINDELFNIDTPKDGVVPMSDLIQTRIKAEVGDVAFVSLAEADALFGDDELVDNGDGILLAAGPIEELAPRVVGIEVSVTRSRFDGHGMIAQFLWEDDAWVPATSDETGLVLPTWVS